MKKECIFCKIINGELPSKKVYENDKVLAFLPKESISKAHMLIIPKKHFESIYDIEEEELKEIIITVKKIARALKLSIGASGINILHASGKDAQQSIFHFHMHLIPRYENDKLDTWPKSKYKENDSKNLLIKIGKIK